MRRWFVTLPVLALSLGCVAQTQSASLSQPDRALARSIFAELIGINTTHSVGSTTVAAQAIHDRLINAGFPAQNITILGPDAVHGTRKNLLVHLAAEHATAKPILFMCHLDVVEAPREQWQTDPFVFTEKDGYFYGRGTQDIKDCDAALTTDLVLLHRAGFRPARDIYFAFTADEEGGGENNGVEWLLQNRPELRQVEFIINPDVGIFAARNGKPYALLYAATEKVYADFDLKIEGPGGHASLPGPDNTIDDLAAALLKIQESPFPVELNDVTRNFFEKMAPMSGPEQAAAIRGVLAAPPNPQAVAALSRDPTMNAMLRTTCVPTLVKGGESPNALPAAATANINCRILPGHARAEIQQRLVQIIANSHITVTYKSAGAPVGPESPEYKGFLPPPENPDAFGPLAKALHEMYPGMPMVPLLEPGASDCVYPAADNIPCYGISGFPQDLDDVRYHARDERLRVESYYAGVEFYRLYIEALAAR